MKSQEGEKNPFVSNEALKKKGGLCVFSNKQGSTENNAGGIVIDRKREVTGPFY